MLSVERIETFYGGIQALHGASLEVRAGEMVSLLGRNGMGKTTTVRSIMGLTPARSGTIRFRGRDIRKLPAYRIARLGIGFVPEGRQIFPNLSVRENRLPVGKTTVPAGISTKSIPCFPSLPIGRISRAVSFPAVSSRCLPSDGPC